MANLDLLNADEQSLLLWMAEAEVGAPDALPPEFVNRDPDRIHATVERLICHGLLCREPALLDGDHLSLPTLYAALTAEGAQVVLEFWRRRRDQSSVRRTA